MHGDLQYTIIFLSLRYGDGPDPANEDDDVFQRLMREADEREEARAAAAEAEEANANAGPTQQQSQGTISTEILLG